MFQIKRLGVAAALALTTIAAPAAASTINVSQQNTNNVFADASGADQFKIITKFKVDGDASGLVYAGAFRLKSDAAGDLAEFLAFCLQPLEHLTLPKAHEIGSTFTAQVTQNLNILAANAWDSVTDSVTAAAFQMAAWEITTEAAANQFDVNAGNFKIIYGSANSNAAEGIANGWLASMNNNDWTDQGQQFTILNADGTQDLLTNVSAVPLPASGLLLLGGLFGAGAVARRRKARTA